MKKTRFLIYLTMVFTAILQAVGSFMGFPNDPMMGGIFWTLVTLSLIVGGFA